MSLRTRISETTHKKKREKEMKCEATGIVTEIFPTKTFGSKGFQKREFRIKEAGESKYPSFLPMTLTKDKCNLADSLTEGTEVKVHFNLTGRIWDKGDGSDTKCFPELNCWKIDILKKGKPMPPVAEPDVPADADFTDDMPF